MSERRTCRVSIKTTPGVSEIQAWVWVEAESIHEAALLGYIRLSRDGWLHEVDQQVTEHWPLIVEQYPPTRGYELKLTQVLRALAKEGGSPTEITRRRRLREIAEEHGLAWTKHAD